MADARTPHSLPPKTPERPLPSEESATLKTEPRRTVRLQRRDKVPDSKTEEKAIDRKLQSPQDGESPIPKIEPPKNFPRSLSTKLVRKRASPAVAPSSAKSVKALIHWLETGSANGEDAESEVASPAESRVIVSIAEHEEIEQNEKADEKDDHKDYKYESQNKKEEQKNDIDEYDDEKTRLEGNKDARSKDENSQTEKNPAKSKDDKSDDKTGDKNGDKTGDQETPSPHKSQAKYFTPATTRRRFPTRAQTAPDGVSPEHLATPRHLPSVNSTLCRSGTDPTKKGLPSTRFTPEEIAPWRSSRSSYITRPIPIALPAPRARAPSSPFRDNNFVIRTDEFIGERDSLTFLNQQAFYNNRPLGRCLDGLEEDEECEKKAERRMTDRKSKRHAMTIQFRLPSETRRQTVSNAPVQQLEGVMKDLEEVIEEQSAAEDSTIAEPPDEGKRSLDEVLAFWNSVRIQLHIDDDDELGVDSANVADKDNGKGATTLPHHSPVLPSPTPTRVPPPTPETMFSSSPPLSVEPFPTLPTLPSLTPPIDQTAVGSVTGLAPFVSLDDMYPEPELSSSSPLGSLRSLVERSTPPAQSPSPALPVPSIPPMPANQPSPGPRKSSAASRSTAATSSSRKTSREIGTSRKTSRETGQRPRQRRMTTEEKMEEIDLILSDDGPGSNH